MKFLFATMPFNGHFNPLTGVAMHLQAAGHDVRWYAGPSYAAKLAQLGIPYLPFQRATEVNQQSIGELFPERAKLHGPALIRFDGKHVFVSNTEKYFEDVQEIDASFPFDVFFCDAAFYAMKFIKEKLGKRVCAFGVRPVDGNLERRSAKLRGPEAGQDCSGPAHPSRDAGDDGAGGHERT